MTEQFINGVYNNCINTVLEDIDESMRETVSLAYKDLLLRRYKNTLKPDDDINWAINAVTELEIRVWKRRNADRKLSALIEDKFFHELIELSNIGFEHAQSKLAYELCLQAYTPVISEGQANYYIKKMEYLFEQVQSFNKDAATMYLSEGVMDFSYASNVTNFTSLRIGRMR